MESRDYFIAAMLELIEEQKVLKKNIAKYIGSEPPHISQFIAKTRNFSETKRDLVAEYLKTNSLDMLTRGKEILESRGQKPINIEDAAHTPKSSVQFEIIANFKNKKTAIEIIKLLLKIEKKDANSLKMIKDILEICTKQSGGAGDRSSGESLSRRA